MRCLHLFWPPRLHRGLNLHTKALIDNPVTVSGLGHKISIVEYVTATAKDQHRFNLIIGDHTVIMRLSAPELFKLRCMRLLAMF